MYPAMSLPSRDCMLLTACPCVDTCTVMLQLNKGRPEGSQALGLMYVRLHSVIPCSCPRLPYCRYYYQACKHNQVRCAALAIMSLVSRLAGRRQMT